MSEFHNPIAEEGDDPWVLFYENAYYYCFSAGNGVYVSKSRRLSEIAGGRRTLVWKAPEGTLYSKEYWAPELHRINGKWYIYVAADDGNNDHHRMFVLEGDEPQGQYQFKGKISDKTDKWAIDGTVLSYQEQLYFVWSGWEGDVNVAQHLYIAPMSNPWTISGDRVRISSPELDWELHGEPLINEGPAALIKNNAVHIVYSASGSWSDDYCLGLLTFRGGDILDAANWHKTSRPVFSKGEEAYGPGHCSFTVSPDGKQDFIVYHANKISGTGWGGRSVRTQPFTWNGDYPVFGKPFSLDAVIGMDD